MVEHQESRSLLAVAWQRYREAASHRWALVASLVVTMAYVVSLHRAWRPAMINVDIDSSWELIMHRAWLEGLRFGQDVVWIGGPYSFVYSNMYYPGTYLSMALLQLAISLPFALLVWHFMQTRLRDALASASLTILCWELCQHATDAEVFTLILVLVTFSSFREVRRAPLQTEPTNGRVGQGPHYPAASLFPSLRSEKILMGCCLAAAALAGLAKHSFLLATAPALVILTVDDVWRRKSVPMALMVYVLCWLGLWLLAGQSLAHIPTYLRSAMEISSGYSEAMHVHNAPYREAWAYLLVATIAVLCFALLLRPAWGWKSVLPVAGLICVLLVVFKGAFVRDGDRGHVALGAVGVLYVLGLPDALKHCLEPDIGKRVRGLRIGALAGAVLVLLIAVQQPLTPVLNQLKYNIGDIPSRFRSFLSVPGSGWERRGRHAARMQRIRAQLPLPLLKGPTDSILPAQAWLLAYGVDLSSKPVIQSYSAYNEYLSELNRAFFEGPSAPRTVVFSFMTIDNRYPSLDCGSVIPAMLTHYRLRQAQPPMGLILEREDAPRHHSFDLLSERDGKVGEMLRLPDTPVGTIVWAEIDLPLTTAGRLLNTLYKPPSVWMEIHAPKRTKGPKIERFRMVPPLARLGFILSPGMFELSDFGPLVGAPPRSVWTENRVESLKIEMSDEYGAGWAYSHAFRARFYSLSYERAGSTSKGG